MASFTCDICKKKGIIGLVGFPNTAMTAFNWYKDKNNYQHTGIYCNKCGTISDCLISMMKLPLSMLGIVSPYKTIANVELMEFIYSVSEFKEEYDLNCREIAVFVLKVDERIIDKMINRGCMGDCFNEPLTREQA